MTHPVDHLDDDLLSAFVDDQLTPDEKFQVQAHFGTCSACQERLDEFRSVAALLRRLPDVEPPRVFFLGPRPLVDPPNVLRLRRWYAVARASAASLAAVFVLLSVGTLYVDSRPMSTETAALSTPKLASAPALAARDAQPAPASGPAAGMAAAPAAVPAATPPTVGAAATRPERKNSEPLDLQAAAATSQRPLPTVPPPPPTAVPPPVAATYTNTTADPAAPLRIAALVAGAMAAVTLLATLVVRHRLQRTASHL